MNKYYNISYPLLHILLTPIMLRKQLMTALLVSLAIPFDAMNVEFRSYANSLNHSQSSQKCNIQKIINNEFDYAQRRIVVRTVYPDWDKYLLWKEDFHRPMMIYKEGTPGYTPLLLNREGELGANEIDFEVVIPTKLYFDISELRKLNAIISKNKLVTKKYRVVYE